MNNGRSHLNSSICRFYSNLLTRRSRSTRTKSTEFIPSGNNRIPRPQRPSELFFRSNYQRISQAASQRLGVNENKKKKSSEELRQLAAQMFAKLPAEERVKYWDLADRDRQVYQVKMATLGLAPKIPITAYLVYHRETIRQLYFNTAGSFTTSASEANRIVSEQWRTLSQTQRDRYAEKADLEAKNLPEHKSNCFLDAPTKEKQYDSLSSLGQQKRGVKPAPQNDNYQKPLNLKSGATNQKQNVKRRCDKDHKKSPSSLSWKDRQSLKSQLCKSVSGRLSASFPNAPKDDIERWTHLLCVRKPSQPATASSLFAAHRAKTRFTEIENVPETSPVLRSNGGTNNTLFAISSVNHREWKQLPPETRAVYEGEKTKRMKAYSAAFDLWASECKLAGLEPTFTDLVVKSCLERGKLKRLRIKWDLGVSDFTDFC